MIFNRPKPTEPTWCELGEAVKPSDEDIRIGWPDDQMPPARQRFNWIDKRQDENIRYLCRVGIAEWDINENYQDFGLVIGSDRSVYFCMRTNSGVDPVFDNTGAWELTNIRLKDGDARYVAHGASMFLTQDMADGRYQLQADMNNFVSWAGGDARYALLSGVSSFLTLAAGDARYALRTDLAGFLSASAAAQTYLRIVDAGNRFLEQSAAAQLYLSIADANNRFSQANSYADTAANNALAGVLSWVGSRLPGLTFHRKDVANSPSGLQGTWLTVVASPNNNNAFELALGSGFCQQGDTIPLPDNFQATQVFIRGWIRQAMGQSTSGDALLNLVFNMGGGSASNFVTNCYFTKSNDGNTQRSGSVCQGCWVGFGHR